MPAQPSVWLGATTPYADTASFQGQSKIVGLSNGNILIVWADDHDADSTAPGRDIVGTIIDATGAAVLGAVRLNVSASQATEEAPVIAATNDGGFILVYETTNANGTSIHAQRHIAAGAIMDTVVVANDVDAAVYNNPSVAVNQADNSFLVTFERKHGLDDSVRSRKYDANLDPMGTEVTLRADGTVSGVEANPRANATIVLSDGRYVTAVSVDKSIFGTTKTVSEYRISNADGSFSGTINNSSSQGFGRLAALTDGGFVAIDVTAAGTLTAREYSSAGVLESTTAVATNVFGTMAGVVGLEDGTFSITWRDATTLALKSAIFFNGGSAPVGSVVDIAAPAMLSGLAVGTTTDGRILLSYNANANAVDVRYQILDSRDSTIFADPGDGQVTGRLTGSSIVGSAAAERLIGMAGNDTIEGGGGADTLVGGNGSDTYTDFDPYSDVLIEAPGVLGGVDRVLIGRSIVWPELLGVSLEVIEMTGSLDLSFTMLGFADAIIGNAGNNLMMNDGIVGSMNGRGGDDTIIGGVNSAVLAGDDGNDLLLAGTALFDTLRGGSGNDTLQGSSGPDTLDGGAGDDTYFNPDPALDLLIEGALNGTDTVFSNTTFLITTLQPDPETGEAPAIERIVLTGTADIDAEIGFGEVIGNSGANRIVSHPAVTFGADTLSGMGGDDTLQGFGGLDRLIGGPANDVYIDPDLAFDTIIELAGEGTDRVESGATFSLATIAHVENLTLTGNGDIDGTGNALANVIRGNAGANILDGGAGADRMEGGNGDDTYHVDNRSDATVEAAGGAAGGIDTVISAVNRTLGTNLEHLTLTGSAVVGTGNALDNRIEGNASGNELRGSDGNDTLIGNGGNDDLRGGAGVDFMDGGLGNDRFFVDTLDDIVSDIPSALPGGVDTVFTPLSYTLGANIENLRLQGPGNLNGTGNELNNKISGTIGANLLQGLGGADVLEGNDGTDTLAGGAGNDTMSGGSQADVFRFTTTNAGADTITDFNKNADRFDLGGGSFSKLVIAPDGDVILTHNGGTIRIDAPLHNLTLAQYNALVLPSGGGARAGAVSTDAGAAGAWQGLDHLAAVARLHDGIVHLGHGDWVFA